MVKAVLCRKCAGQMLVVMGEHHFFASSRIEAGRGIIAAYMHGWISQAEATELVKTIGPDTLPKGIEETAEGLEELTRGFLHADVREQLTEDDLQAMKVQRPLILNHCRD